MINKKKFLLLILSGFITVFVLSSLLAYTLLELPNRTKGLSMDQESPDKIVTFTQEDNGETINLPIREIFRVILPENPTTGYRWTLSESTTSNIVLLQQEYCIEDQDISKVGGGGSQEDDFSGN